MLPFATLCFVVLLPIIPALILFKALPTSRGSVDGKLQGLEIKLSGAFAGYFAVVLLVIANSKALLPPVPQGYQVWKVTGQVVDETGQPIDPLGTDSISIVDPKPFDATPPGTFSVMYYSSPGANGYPKLSISPPGYESVCISLDPGRPQIPGCLTNGIFNGGQVNVGAVMVKKSNPYPDLPPLNTVSGGSTPAGGKDGPK